METVGGLGPGLTLRLPVRSLLFRLAASPATQRLGRRAAEWRRRLAGRPHRISAFLELDDPYSYLLSRFLPDLAAKFAIDLCVLLVAAPAADYRPGRELHADHARLDCARLARELGIPFLDRGNAPPVEFRRRLLDAIAAQDSMDELFCAIEDYWRGDAGRVQRRVEGLRANRTADAVLARNRDRLMRLGHYNSAMLHYGGEWYWGVDRLHYLTERLDDLRLGRSPDTPDPGRLVLHATQVTLPVEPPAAARKLPELELFFSFRSPYSYLVLPRAFAIADAFGMSLRIRPVLPMIARAMPVPRRKLLYIVRDAAREARRLQMPFGPFRDPAGAGVERCIAAFRCAEAEGRGRAFVRHAAEAIWTRAVDVASDEGMRDVASRAGMEWSRVSAALAGDSWRELADRNRESMMASGSWGVPTLRVGDFAVWGQDRIWMLVRHLETCCASAQGILE